jgi:outer membrane lipoprotein-sorting protein
MSSPLKRSTALLVLLLFLTACRSQSETGTQQASTDTVVSSTPPFQTKEPDRYRATRTITIVARDGHTLVSRRLIARDGEMRRQDGTDGDTLTYLDLPNGRFLLSTGHKIYADLAEGTGIASAEDDEDFTSERLLHGDDNHNTSYQKLGLEAIDGRNANKYRVLVNSSAAGNVSQSETLIWIDEGLNMPVKSETVSNGTRITMQLSELSLEVDKGLFQIPESYEKVTFNEFHQRLKKTE